MCSNQTTIALLKSKEITSLALLLKAKNLLTYVLKTCQYLDQLHSVVLCNSIRHIGCDNCFDQCPILRQTLQSLDLADLIFCEKTAGHISCQGNIFPTLLILYIYAKTIRIWVCRQHQIRILLLRKLKCKSKCLLCLWIWIAHSRELSIRQLLFWHNIYILKAKLLQHSSRRNISCAMKRCINNGQILLYFLDNLRMANLCLKLCNIAVINRSSNRLVKSHTLRLCLLHRLHCIIISNSFNLSHNPSIMWRRNLCAILPIYLIAIVFWWIMARCNINSSDTTKLSHRIRKLWRRAKRFKYICLNTVCSQT